MDIYDVIGYTLRIGVIISAILIVTGIVITIIHGSSNGYPVNDWVNPKSPLNSSVFVPINVLKNLDINDGMNFVWLGLMVLIATPVLRVILGIADFAKQRNYLYTIITAIVLFNLLFAIFILPLILAHH
ncbi:MAG: DUF1634 domain-containing protein [Sulfolobaceae archaeon]|nr:DUF1634 domain-containing protein [Sulfolobaceae archaeon]